MSRNHLLLGNWAALRRARWIRIGSVSIALALGAAAAAACSGAEMQRSVITAPSPDPEVPPLQAGVNDGAPFIADRLWGAGRAIAASTDSGLTAIVTTTAVFVAEDGAEIRQVATYPGATAGIEVELSGTGAELIVAQADRVWTIDVASGAMSEFDAGAAVRDVFTGSGRSMVSTASGVFEVGLSGLQPLYDGVVPAGVVGTGPFVLVPVAASADVVIDDGAAPRQVTLALGEEEHVTDASVSTGGVIAVASSPAGDPFDTDDRINVIDLTSGGLRASISANGPLQASAWTTTDDHVVVAGSGSFRVWTLDGIDVVDVPLPTDRPVVATLQVSGGVMTVHSDGAVFRWPPETWTPAMVAEGGTTQLDVDVSDDGSTVTSVGFYGAIEWRSGADGRMLDREARFEVGETTDVAFSPSGQLAFSSSAGNVVVLDDGFGEVRTLHVTPDRRSVDAVGFSQDGSMLATGVAERVGDSAYDDTVVVWDGSDELSRHSGDEAAVSGCGFYNSRVSFSADGRWLAVSSHDFTVDIYNASTQQLIASVDGPTSILDLAFLPEDGRLLVAYDDATVSVRDPDDFSEVATFETAMGGYQALAPLGTSGLLAVADIIGDVSIVRSADGVAVRQLGSTGARLSSLAASNDGSLVAAPDASGGIIVWSTADGAEVSRLAGHGGPVTGLAFSANADTLASTSRDGTVRSWSRVEE